MFATAGLSQPFGLATDAVGNLYASNNGGTTVERFTPNGTGTVFGSGLGQPSGLAFDPSGNLDVSNSGNNTIERFTAGGVGSVFINTNLNDPIGLAVQVPEPSSWVLLGVGVGLLGLTLRQRACRG